LLAYVLPLLGGTSPYPFLLSKAKAWHKAPNLTAALLKLGYLSGRELLKLGWGVKLRQCFTVDRRIVAIH
jgi:hypothetical protein